MATRDEIYREVVTVLIESFALAEQDLAPSARLVADLDLDSIDAIDLAVQLEDRLGFAPKGQDLRAIVTVDDLVSFINDRQHAGATVEHAPPSAKQP